MMNFPIFNSTSSSAAAMQAGRRSRLKLVVVKAACFIAGISVSLSDVPGPLQSTPLLAQETATNEEPLAAAIKVLERSYNELRKISDYEATLLKREVVNGKLISQRIQMKLKEEPFSVYLKFVEPNAGRQLLFVAGANNNKLKVREAGLSSLAGNLDLEINSQQVLAENRYTIKDIGLRRLLEMLATQWQNELKLQRPQESQVKYFPNAKLGNADCEVIEVLHPVRRAEYPFHLTRIYIEKTTLLPIRLENYDYPTQAGQPPAILEEYTYVEMRTNVGLTSNDFHPDNPAYSFKR